jgi:hypothetical protein
MKGWVGLAAIGLLVGLEVALVEHLAARDGAAVLLASWDLSVVLEFAGVLALRIGLYLGLPPLLVVLLASRAAAARE